MATTGGLRERKKQATREAIAAAAMELFHERGFDEVTVAEVAEAADVSEKTVFNYFPSKEELVFHPRAEWREELFEKIRERPPGASIVEPFRLWTLHHLDGVETRPVNETVAGPRLIMGSKALRDRLFLAWEEEAALLAPVIAEQTGDDDLLVPTIVARTLAWTHRLVFRAAFTRIMAGESRRAVAADLRVKANHAYDALEQGLKDY